MSKSVFPKNYADFLAADPYPVKQSKKKPELEVWKGKGIPFQLKTYEDWIFLQSEDSPLRTIGEMKIWLTN